MYYSQHKEDQILNKLIKKERGICIEVGGFDGVSNSNSYFFENIGWDCLIVEPIPSLYEKIKKNRTCKVINCAASDQNGATDFFIANGAEDLSSINPDLHRISNYHESQIKKINVIKKTLNTILNEFRIEKIDFITIDVEGHEHEVLKGFDLLKYEPEIVILEDNFSGNDRSLEKYMLNFDYILFKRTGCNDWYTKKANKKYFTNLEYIYVHTYMKILKLYNKLPDRFKKLYRFFKL
jgi:FkbM family methyltransferase